MRSKQNSDCFKVFGIKMTLKFYMFFVSVHLNFKLKSLSGLEFKHPCTPMHFIYARSIQHLPKHFFIYTIDEMY